MPSTLPCCANQNTRHARRCKSPHPPYLGGMYAARNLEDALAAPAETGELHLVVGGFDAFPLEVLTLPNLRLLDLSQNLLTTLPPEIGQLTQLEVLILRGNALRQLPPEVGQMRHLQRLDLERNQLQALPEALQYCEALRELRLSHNIFEAWPGEAIPPQLESLLLSRNMLRELPESIRHLQQLSYLDISDNRLQQLPHSLVLLDRLEHIMLAGNPLGYALPSVDPESDLAHILKELRRSKANASDHVRWWRLLQGDATLLADEEPYLLAAALDSPLTPVRAAAALLLPQWFPSPLPKKGPADILFAGTISGKTKYQRALQQAGFQILLRQQPDTIVVLGDRPAQAGKQAFAAGNRIAYEGHLEEWLKAAQGEYLSGKAKTHPMTTNLRRLIRTYRKENIEMALVMMSRAGVPPELLTELLAVKLFHTDPEIQQKAAQAFSQLAEKQLQAFVDRQVAQHDIALHPEKVAALVQALLRNTSLNASALIDAAVDLAGGGLGLVLLLPDSERLPHFEKFLKAGQLQLSNLQLPAFPLALAQLPALRYLMLSRNRLQELPSDLQPFSQLEMLDLAENALTAMPDGIGILRQLKGLDLSSNRLRHLPDSIGEMQALEALRLDRNPLLTLPASLTQLPSLEMLGLFGCKFAHFPEIVWQLGGLRSLDVGECNLHSLPANIAGFAHLESLSLRNNPLAQLPEWLGDLPALRFLDLSMLPGRTLPERLRGHAQLERIYLLRDESMDWEQVIPILASMPRLRYAYFRGRKIVRNIQLLMEEKLPRVRVSFGN
jgi:Leucine-rich repeat (LRR) protein